MFEVTAALGVSIIKLKCCKQFIHKGCIIELVVNNDVFNCPICRSKIKLCDSITFGKIKIGRAHV